MKIRRSYAIISTSIILLGTGALAPVSAATVTPSYRLKVLTNNIAGGLINDGNPAALDSVQAEITSYQPDVVMLEEVCDSQYTDFQQRFEGWYTTYTQMRNHHPRCIFSGVAGGGQQGQVLASKWPMTNITTTVLGGEDYGVPNKTDPKVFKLMCADLAITGVAKPVHACVTHLRAFNTAAAEKARTAQTAKIRSTLAPYTNTSQAVVVSGDFNSGPDRLPNDNMYRLDRKGQLRGKGAFYEADQSDRKYFPAKQKRGSVTCSKKYCRSGQPTHWGGADNTYTSKLDYVFFSAKSVVGANRVSGLRVDNPTSDHGFLQAWADLK